MSVMTALLVLKNVKRTEAFESHLCCTKVEVRYVFGIEQEIHYVYYK